jgi:hypothetical protein
MKMETTKFPITPEVNPNITRIALLLNLKL